MVIVTLFLIKYKGVSKTIRNLNLTHVQVLVFDNDVRCRECILFRTKLPSDVILLHMSWTVVQDVFFYKYFQGSLAILFDGLAQEHKLVKKIYSQSQRFRKHSSN